MFSAASILTMVLPAVAGWLIRHYAGTLSIGGVLGTDAVVKDMTAVVNDLKVLVADAQKLRKDVEGPAK